MLEFGSGQSKIYLFYIGQLYFHKIDVLKCLHLYLKQGENQWIVINFKERVKIKRIEIKFQGGFCSSQAKLEVLDENKKNYISLFDFYPLDNNSNQVCFCHYKLFLAKR